MMLVRHASHGHLGDVLSGRLEGQGLTDQGRQQAWALANALSVEGIDRIETSPVQRARETALAIAERMGALGPVEVAALDEIDFGEWTGRSFAELASDHRWRRWNTSRGSAQAPGGESMVAAQSRIWSHIEDIARSCEGAVVALVTHCDMIRAAVARVLGLSLDRILRFAIDPASVTRIAVGEWGAELKSLNERPWRSEP